MPLKPLQPSRRALSRRQFLRESAVVGAGLSLAGCRLGGRKPLGKPGQALDAREMALCAAACERILPADADPGAAQLGVAEYIDSRLTRRGRRVQRVRRTFRHGLDLLARWSESQGEGDFLALPPEKQDVVLASFAAEGGDEGYDFVRQLMRLTLEGAFSDPSYGGNRDKGGWKLVGFDAPCPNPRCQ